MANPYSPVPSVEPEAGLPDVYQHVQATPEAFGAGVARAKERTGAAISGFGHGVTQFGDLMGEVAADDSSNRYAEKINSLLYGGPDVVGPNGQPLPGGFLSLQGQEAMNARPWVEQQMQSVREAQRAGLYTTKQLHQFDNEVRRQKAFADTKIGSHYDGQAKEYAVNTNVATVDLQTQRLAQSPDDPAIVSDATHKLTQALVRNVMLKGGGTEVMAQAVMNAEKSALLTRVDAIAVKEPGRARDLLDANRLIAGDKYDNASTKLRNRIEGEDAVAGATALFQSELAKSQTPPGAEPPAAPGAQPPPAPGGKPPTEAGAMRRSLEPQTGALYDRLKEKLAKQGVDIGISSGRRAAPPGAKQGRPGHSQHEDGKAFDVPTGGKDEAALKKTINEILADPEVTGFGYEPASGHIHVDTRPGGKMAWGDDKTTASVGQNWPAWMTEQVKAWRGTVKMPTVTDANLDRMKADLAQGGAPVTPQEEHLYRIHQEVLKQGGISHHDRSTSTLLQASLTHDGRVYNVPTIWGGKILPDTEEGNKQLREQIDQAGWDQFPSYATQAEAEARYQKMHDYMERDMPSTGAAPPPALPPPGKSQGELMAALRQAQIADAEVKSIAAIRNSGKDVKTQQMMITTIMQEAGVRKGQVEAHEKVRKEQVTKASGDYLKMSQDSFQPELVKTMWADARIPDELKVHLQKLMIEAAGNKSDLWQYGLGFSDAQQRLLLPYGDPNKITSPEEIIKLSAEGKITRSGRQQLLEDYHQIHSGTDAATVNKQAAEMIQYAKYRFLGGNESDEYYAATNKAGLLLLSGTFIPKFYGELKKWTQDGKKDPLEFLTKEKMDEMIGGITSERELANMKLHATREHTGDGMTEAWFAAQKTPPPPPNVHPVPWARVMDNPPDVFPDKAPPHPMTKAMWAEGITRLLANPSEQNQAKFDARMSRGPPDAEGNPTRVVPKWTAKDLIRQMPPYDANAPMADPLGLAPTAGRME